MSLIQRNRRSLLISAVLLSATSSRGLESTARPFEGISLGTEVVGEMTTEEEGLDRKASVVGISPLLLTTVSALNETGRRKVLLAKEDAQFFYLTHGEYRTAVFNQAIEVIREAEPQLPYSDLELAEMMLTL